MNALVDRLVRLQQEFANVYNKPVIGVQSGWVHVSEEGMTSIAPMEQWNRNIKRDCELYRFEHEITLQGVKFIALTVDPIILEQVPA